MRPVFILAYPRSRTAWLSVFLTGAGIPCFHEAWKQVTTAKDLRLLMESRGADVVANSDCANIFFLRELREEFPDALYIYLKHDERAVWESLQSSYGPHDYQVMFECYRRAFDGVTADLTIDCATWGTSDTLELWDTIAPGRELDLEWLAQSESFLVQLMPWQIEQDKQRAASGDFPHIEQRMRGDVWV